MNQNTPVYMALFDYSDYDLISDKPNAHYTLCINL
jgi:hypothetical protein